MSVSHSVSHYLANTRADYEVLHHDYTFSARETARRAHIHPGAVMKAVMLKATGNDHIIMAIIPGDRRINLAEASELAGFELELLPEYDLPKLFHDCDYGAVPPFGDAYDIDVIWDSALLSRADLYGEAGDHMDLIHIDAVQFREIYRGRPHGKISEPLLH